MTTTIKVHALSRGGYFANAEADGRHICVADTAPECSPDRAARKCALKIIGLQPSLLGEDQFEEFANKAGLELRHINSNLDEETYRLTAPSIAEVPSPASASTSTSTPTSASASVEGQGEGELPTES